MSSVLQVCYVVVSSGWDRHAQMAWLSATSVRIQSPQARIVVVVEGTQPGAASVLQDRFAGTADVLARHSDVADPVRKSRYHRIALREYLPGPLLYVDSDTLAVGDPTDVDTCREDVGAVIDFNDVPERAWCPPELAEPFTRHGWTFPLAKFRNAGVFFVRDTDAARVFCRAWMARWSEPSPPGLHHVWDQVTFNSALADSGVTGAVLPNAYNAMVVKRNYRFRDAKILHFFGSEAEQRGTLLAHLLTHLERHNEFDRAAYDRSIRQGHPWGPDPEPWQLRHSRNHMRAAYVKARRTMFGR